MCQIKLFHSYTSIEVCLKKATVPISSDWGIMTSNKLAEDDPRVGDGT